LAALQGHFRPEFVNRIDDVVVFHALDKAQIGAILAVQMQALENLLAARQLKLTLSAAAQDYLAAAGYDPAYGARPLKRTLQRELQNPLAAQLLQGTYKPGDTVAVDLASDGSKLIFTHGVA
jgi:ATP-dependent Clp protease ATP-binding subunit ClpB